MDGSRMCVRQSTSDLLLSQKLVAAVYQTPLTHLRRIGSWLLSNGSSF
jgi:hypothetical protein